MAQRVGRGIALLFHDRSTRRRWVVSSTPWPHFTPGKDREPILQEAGWAPGPVWTGGKSRPHRDSIPDRPARSSVAIPTELPGPHVVCVCVCVCVYIYIYTHTHTCIYMLLIYVSTSPILSAWFSLMTYRSRNAQQSVYHDIMKYTLAHSLRVRYPTVSLKFFIYIILPAAL